jgi:hypothetical protein
MFGFLVWGGCNFVVSEERQENIDMVGVRNLQKYG